MKKIYIYFLGFLIISPIYFQLNPSQGIIKQDTLDNQWHPFSMQNCGSSTLIIYSGGSTNNQVNVKIITDNITGFNLFIASTKKISETGYEDETLRINNTGTTEFTFETTTIRLRIETTGDEKTVHKVIANGQFSINNGPLTDFEICRCYPITFEILHSSKFIYHLTIDLNVTEITNNSLIIEYAKTDAVMNREVSDSGLQSFLFNASYVSFTMHSEGIVKGFYRISGSESEPISITNMNLFFALIPLLILVLKKKVF